MKEKILEYFTFTRKERLGVIVLLIIILILFIVPYWIRRPPGTEDPEATRQFAPLLEKPAGDSSQDNISDGLSSPARSTGTGDYRERYNTGKSDAPVKLFYFDPNVAGEADWQRLGLSERQSLTLVHYTGKGGRFRTPADLEKIYGLSASDRARLMPYVRIGASYASRNRSDVLPRGNRMSKSGGSYYPGEKSGPGNSPFADNRNRRSSGNAAGFGSYPNRYPKKSPAVIDINRSDSLQWEQLPGIGEKLASRIIRFREKLGGFYCVGQVAETYGLPDSAFQKIRPWLQSDSTAIQHIDLNTVSEITLRQHPYVRWKLAAVLLRYREQHGRFQSMDELNQVALLDAEALKRLRPYLELSK